MIDLIALFGTLIGISAILGGQWLEGGHIGQIAQLAAAVIVLGGTVGAVLVSFPGKEIALALKMLPQVYRTRFDDPSALIGDIVRIATVARKEGVLAIEMQMESVRDPMFRRCLQYVIDGFEPATVREILEFEIDASRQREESAARVFEAAGGYAPTIGILGAVLGLIHVMSMLNEPSKIGDGIAVAFVATVYGVALANLVFLPWGSKLKRLADENARIKELVVHGVLGIQEGLNPNFLGEKLKAFLQDPEKQK
ncbi:MAG: flagellar motor protein [Bdellovibrionales bacterium]|nr:flagellar motor protein [Bdellovibrionales bacterium]